MSARGKCIVNGCSMSAPNRNEDRKWTHRDIIDNAKHVPKVAMIEGLQELLGVLPKAWLPNVLEFVGQGTASVKH